MTKISKVLAVTALLAGLAPMAAQASSGQLNAHTNAAQSVRGPQAMQLSTMQHAENSPSKGRFQENAPDFGNFRFGVEQTAGNAAPDALNNVF